jgi:hypothetical protein
MELYRLYDAADAGKDGYPAAWHETIKHDVREQAGHRCVRCKHPYRTGQHPMEIVNGKYESWSPCDEQCSHEGPLRSKRLPTFDQTRPGLVTGYIVIVEAKARILTVHHLDEVKLNCRWWNLASLCQRCHLTIQGRVKMHRPYFLEHSEWFRPYVAGFYASTILGEELTREQVLGRLDELLALASKETPK